MIFYFTATGNSLYVARQLDEQLRSIPLELARPERHYEAPVIGIVSPVFYHELPDPVREFVRTSSSRAVSSKSAAGLRTTSTLSSWSITPCPVTT